jgi:hypothetical protein
LVGIRIYGNGNSFINPETGDNHQLSEDLNSKSMVGGVSVAIDSRRYFIHNKEAEHPLTILDTVTNETRIGFDLAV